MKIVTVLQYEGSTPVVPGEQMQMFNAWLQDAVSDLLWSTDDIVSALGLTQARVYQLIKDGRIPGAITVGKTLFYVRKFAEPWAAEYVANRKGRPGTSIVPGAAKAPRVAKPAKLKLPRDLKVVQEETPNLIVSDHNIPLESCTPFHHHWSEWEGIPGKRGSPSKAERARRGKFVEPIGGLTTPTLLVPARFANVREFAHALAAYYAMEPKLVAAGVRHQPGKLPYLQYNLSEQVSPEVQQTRDTCMKFNLSMNKWIEQAILSSHVADPKADTNK